LSEKNGTMADISTNRTRKESHVRTTRIRHLCHKRTIRREGKRSHPSQTGGRNLVNLKWGL